MGASPEELRNYHSSLGENEEGWKRLIYVISGRLCLEKLHLSLDAGVHSDLTAQLARDDEEAKYLIPRLRRFYKRLLAPVVWELKGRLEMFHVFLCWSIEAEGIAERMVLGEGSEILMEGKIEYYTRDKRNPHWKVLEEEGEVNKRTITGLEDLRMFEMDKEEDIRWLQAL